MSYPSRFESAPSHRHYWALLVLLAVGAALVLASCGGSSGEPRPTAAPEAESSVVHPCNEAPRTIATPRPAVLRDPLLAEAISQEVPFTASPSATPFPKPTLRPTTMPTPTPLAVDAGCVGPDFKQNCAIWGPKVYDHGDRQALNCGSTFAQCGCAVTAMASVLTSHGVGLSPDGEPTNPLTLNDWFIQDGRLTEAGLVSKGYVYGGVNWVAMAEYSQAARKAHQTPSLAWVAWTDATFDLSVDLREDNPVILEEPGHFIVATGLEGDTYRISDPAYERATLDVPQYGNRFLSARRYAISEDGAAIMVAAPAGVQILVTDPDGNELGSETPDAKPKNEIPRASITREPAWADPTCTAAPSLEDAGVTMAVIPSPSAGRYSVDVASDSGRYSVAIYAYDREGQLTLSTFDGEVPPGEKQRIDLDYDPEPDSEQEVVLAESTAPQPGPTEGPLPPIVPPAATEPASPTTSPPPTTPPMTIVSFEVDPGFCKAVISWQVTGDAQGTVTLYRDGAQIYQTSVASEAYTDPPQPQGTLSGNHTWRLEATNSVGQTVSSDEISFSIPCLF